MIVLQGDADAADALVGPEHLGGGVLRSLARSFRGQYSWGVVSTLLLGLVSFGVLPLLRWTQNFRRYVLLERQQLWHLAEWLRLQTAHPDAEKLPGEAERINWRAALAATSLVWVGAVVFVFAMELWFRAGSDGPLRSLLSWTYGYRFALGKTRLDLFCVWTLCLSIAYALHWLQIQLHAGDVRRFVERFNAVAQWQGVEPLSPPRVGVGVQPWWIVGSVGLIVAGAWWGLPMMLAGAVQRRYISRTSSRLRAEAADRVRAMLLLRRPALRVPSFARPAIRCRGQRCRAPIPPLANFCARCGARAGTVISDVA